MSDRLAISASISVLMMSIWVLFGTETARVPLAPIAVEAPGASMLPVPLQALVTLQ